MSITVVFQYTYPTIVRTKLFIEGQHVRLSQISKLQNSKHYIFIFVSSLSMYFGSVNKMSLASHLLDFKVFPNT